MGSWWIVEAQDLLSGPCASFIDLLLLGAIWLEREGGRERER